jgi:hypothetical protein
VSLGGAFLAPAHAPDARVVSGEIFRNRHAGKLCEAA